MGSAHAERESPDTAHTNAPKPSRASRRRVLDRVAPDLDSLLAQLSRDRASGSAPAASSPRIRRSAAPPPASGDLTAARIRPASGAASLPDGLTAGVEALSGLSMDGVRVHYNSPRPAQLSALAFTQGTDIHVAPGQEQHLPHEAWHVVQQAQGRVRPIGPSVDGGRVNEDARLEREADAMGARAAHPSRDEARGSVALAPIAGAPALVQLVRKEIGKFGAAPTLQSFEAMIVAVEGQIAELGEERAMGFWDAKDEGNLARWKGLLDTAIVNLRNAAPGNAAFSFDQITARENATTQAFHSVMIPLANIRGLLNKKHLEFEAFKNKSKESKAYEYVETEEHKTKNDPDTQAREAQKRLRAQKAGSAGGRRRGLGDKWGTYNKDLKRTNQLTFVQHVPEGAATIEACLRSGSICDALYNPQKAFWLADPARFKLGSAAGKFRMEYTFNAAGAQSLMEDYLICGSGDFSTDNEEPWVGETQHPYYTIWKTNELGAYGVGSARLEELRGFVQSIKAFDPQDKEIKFET